MKPVFLLIKFEGRSNRTRGPFGSADSYRMDSRLVALQQRIGHRFARPGPPANGRCTHRSFGTDHNERLEFLGDAVLEPGRLEPPVRPPRRLRRRRPDPRPRPPQCARTACIAPRSSSACPSSLRLGEGEARGGGALRASILADALEALIGATFLDGGLERRARRWCTACSARVIETTDVSRAGPRTPRPSSRNGCRRGACRCRPTASSPPAARRTPRPSRSSARCRRSACSESGEGKSRRAAEQEAARRMLDALSASDEPGSPLRS